MTKSESKNINNLNQDLQNVYEEINNTDIDVEFAYGSDEDTLVIVSQSKGPSKEFRVGVAESIMSTLEKPCGFILSDGPNEYDKYTTAYIRSSPTNSYEYVLAPLCKLNFKEEDVTEIFHKVYSISEGKQTDSNPRLMAATYLYIISKRKDINNNSITHIANIMGVSEDDIRNYVTVALNDLRSY